LYFFVIFAYIILLLYQLGRPDKRSDAQGILGFIGREFAGRPTGLYTCLVIVERGQRGNSSCHSSSSSSSSRSCNTSSSSSIIIIIFILIILLHVLLIPLISPIITTVTIHYFYSFPILTQNPPFLRILPIIDPAPPIRLLSWTRDCSSVFFVLVYSVIIFTLICVID